MRKKKIFQQISAFASIVIILMSLIVIPTNAEVTSNYQIKGLWYFKGSITEFKPTEYINFTSNGTQFTAISRHATSPQTRAYSPDPNEEVFMLYYDTTEVYSSIYDWIDEAMRTVNFGKEYQTITEEFYTWITANATYQGNDAGTTTPSTPTEPTPTEPPTVEPPTTEPPQNEPLPIVSTITGIITAGIGTMAVGLGQGLSQLVQSIFISTANDGTMNLSTFGGVIIIFAGLALAIGLSKWITNWLSNMGK